MGNSHDDFRLDTILGEQMAQLSNKHVGEAVELASVMLACVPLSQG